MKRFIVWLFMLCCMPNMAQSLTSEKREVLARSFRLMREDAVPVHVFEEIAKEQLLERYYIHKVDGKRDLVEIRQWQEEVILGVSQISCKTLNGQKEIPTAFSIEVIEQVSEGELKVTQLEPKRPGLMPIVYVQIAENLTFEAGTIVNGFWLPENCNIFKAKVPIGIPTYRMLSEEEGNTWHKPTLKDLSSAYQHGYKFVVKTKTYKFKCPTCGGSGVDKTQMTKIQNEIKQSKSSKRSMLSSQSKSSRLRQANRNKPKCKVCNGKTVLLFEEFRRLNFYAE